MKHNVYVLGSINIDLMISANRMPQQGETISGYDFMEMLGGKGCNQATASAKLGAKTHLIGSVGRDYYGQSALNQMNKNGIDTSKINISNDEHTGTALITKIDNDNRIIINQGANGNFTVDTIAKAMVNGQEGDFFLTQFEVPLYAVYEGLKIARNQKMITVVNPAPAAIMSDDFYPLIDYLVVNQSECETLTKIYASDLESCRLASTILFSRGIKNVIFTLGSEGSVLISEDEEIFANSYKVSVLDTTGAGDTFIGAFLYCLSQGHDKAKAMIYASAAGALACSAEGAQEGLKDLKQLEDFIKEAIINE